MKALQGSIFKLVTLFIFLLPTVFSSFTLHADTIDSYLYSSLSGAVHGGAGGDEESTAQQHNNHFIKYPYEGTQSCLLCHTKEGEDVLKTGHWKWQGVSKNIQGAETEIHGKNDFINNFCVAVPSNEGRCAECHIGYGYKEKNFDFTDPRNIDCLVCHDQTGTYKKGATTAGAPDPSVDLQLVARSVADNGGIPGRANCIYCHANAGGGDNVKHGDLSMSLAATTREYDVHMGTDGANMRCVDCHDVDRDALGEPISHGIGGMPYHSVDEGSIKQCVDCHDSTTHQCSEPVLNMVSTHQRLACQVCHIPAIARETSTMVEWYWSTAGQDIEPIPVDPVTGRPTYNKKKGSLVWALNVRPTLRFHNGKWNKKIINDNDTITTEPVDLGSPAASRDDPDAMIYPFKKMIGDQVADIDNTNHRVVVPHLFGRAGGDNPYWAKYDWNSAIRDGTTYSEQRYSGNHGFVNTQMLLTVNHEIAPAEKALGANGNCSDCHAEGLIDWPALGLSENPYEEKGKGGKTGNK